MRISREIGALAALFAGSMAGTAVACSRDGTPGPCHCLGPEAIASFAAPALAPLSSFSPISSDVSPRDTFSQTVHVFDIDFSTHDADGPIMDAVIHLGDTVHWVWDSGFHNVESVVGSVEQFDSGFNFPAFTFDHTFTHTGTTVYYCAVHGFDNMDGTADGMAGTITVLPAAISSSWSADASGDWSPGANWSGGAVPNGPDHSATFGASITSPRTVTLDSPQSVGSINFSSPIAYTIAGSNALTIDGVRNQGVIAVTAGSHTISAPVVLNEDTTISTATGTGVALTGDLTATGRTITKDGLGTAQFEKVVAAALRVNVGSITIRAKGTANSPAGTSVLQSLSIEAGANLDLTNNSMVIDYDDPVGSQVTDIRDHLKSGRLSSSSATATTRLGYGDNAILGKTTFAGQSVDSSSILIKYTYAGDADLDGDADGVDIGTWATNFTGELGGSGSQVWTQGDWDYDGDVDGVDAGLWAQAFTGELGGGGLGDVVVNDPHIAPGAAAILRGMGITVVPEPVLGCIIALALTSRLSRRRAGGGTAPMKL